MLARVSAVNAEHGYYKASSAKRTCSSALILRG
jgi:hypothetical protein